MKTMEPKLAFSSFAYIYVQKIHVWNTTQNASTYAG